jgi:hypothetical protein
MTADRATRLAIAGCFAYLAARLVYFALAIDPSVPPDETTHLGRVLAFAGTWGIPEPGSDNYALGLLGERAFLYNWVLARLAWVGALGRPDESVLPLLRLVNVAMALGTAFYALRFIRVVTSDRLTHVVFLVLFTNTLMFTGLGAAVTYDNGANLLAAASFYYLARLFQEWDANDFASLAIVAGLGCLTKRSFLPLAALIAAAVLLHEHRQLRHAASRLRGMGAARAAVVAAIALTNLFLYGGNWIEYGRLVPHFDQVVGVEAARENRIFARDYLLDGFREGRLELAEALKLTTEIDHDGDRMATRRQLAGLARRGDWRVEPWVYATTWGRIMLDRTFGYFGHQVIHRAFWERAAYGAILLLAVGFHVAAWRQDPRPRQTERWGAAIAWVYLLVVLLLVNYPNYAERGILDAGVHGRYLFPVWAPLIGWVACALGRDAPKRLRVPVCVAACGIFVLGDLPVFLLRATPAWFGGTP